MANEIAVKDPISTMAITEGKMTPSTFDQLWRLSEIVAASGMAPKALQQPAQLVVAAAMGMEIGLSYMQSIQGIAVINGRPSLWGDAMLGLIQASGTLEAMTETTTGEYPDPSYTAICTAKRKGGLEYRNEFSIADAKEAGLWGKPGPWQSYKKRMLKMRARAYTLRDGWADVLKGLHMAEEMVDAESIEMERSGTSYRAIQQNTEPIKTLAERAKEAGRTATKALMQEPGTEKTRYEGPAEPVNRVEQPEPDGQTMAIRAARVEADRQVSGLPIIDHIPGVGKLFKEPDPDHFRDAAEMVSDEPPPWADAPPPAEPPQQETVWGSNPDDRLGDEPGKKTLKRLHKAVTARGYDKAGVKLAMRRWEIHRVGEKIRRPFDVDSTDDILRTDAGLWDDMLDSLTQQHVLLTMIRDREKQIPGFNEIVKKTLSEADPPVTVSHWYLMGAPRATSTAKSLDDIALEYLENHGDAREPDETN